jgi:hypothetical protein
MTEPRNPLIGQALERWRVQGEAPAWQDVLARAGLAEQARRPGWFRRRLETPERFYAAVLLAGAVVVAAPAFAIVAHHLLRARPVPGTTTTTRVELGSGRSAELRLRSRGSPLGRDSAGFRFLRTGTGQPRFFRWTLELHGLEQVTGARITLRGQVIRLCGPCRTGGGVFVLRDADALELLNGRATLTVGEARHRVAPAAGGRLLQTLGLRRKRERDAAPA